jgi:hypothetical protein
MGLLGRESRFLDDRADELLGPLRVDEARLPHAEDLRHLGRLDVLVHELGVVRLEQLGELFARVLDEIGERLQAGEDDHVPGEQLLPQLIARHVRVDDDVHG